ncbi:MAG: peptidoglycan-binding domain-containing protein [Patescibacteria group bacterium]
MKKFYASLFASFIFLTLPVFSIHADTPSVVSFSAPTSLGSGQVGDFTWTINGGGHSIIFFCPQGVTLRYASTNQSFPCDTATSISGAASEGVSLNVINVSGSGKILTVRLTPKDASAVNFDAGAREVSLYVNPSAESIGNFYTTATTTISGAATNFYWTSPYLGGVNFKIGCNSFIVATSSSYNNGATVPCGQVIFPTDLPGSGSMSMLFKNSSQENLPLEVTILPAMSPGVYDGGRSKSIQLSVTSDAQKAISLSTFSVSRQKIFSGDSVAFNWSFVNGSGANIKISCAAALTYTLISTTTSTTLPCNEFLATTTSFGATASTSIFFFNSEPSDQAAIVSIFPQLKDGTYTGSNAASVKITVQPIPKSGTISPVTTTTSTIVTTPTISTPVITNVTTGGKNIFKRALDVGSRGADVTALQTFFAKDKIIYPEGSITGYFGPATKRAVGRFQIKFAIIKTSSDPSYGFVGPKTRALLNSQQ